MPQVPTDAQNANPAQPIPMTPVESAPTSGTGVFSASSVPAPTPQAPIIPPQTPHGVEEPSNLFPLNNYEDVKIRSARATQFGKTPEQAARIFNAESKTGLPTEYIEQNLEDVEKEADTQGFSAADFSKRNPKFASWLAQNPNNYALSKDDLDNGKALESSVNDYSLMQSAHDSLYKGFADFNAGLAKLPAFAYDVAAAIPNAIVSSIGYPELQVRAPEEWYNNAVTKYFEEKSKISLENNPDLQADIIEMVANKNYERAGRAIFANVVTNAPNAMALMLGAGAGMAAESLAFAGAQTGAQAASSPENQSADPLTSTVNAVTKGGFEAAFEEMGTLKVLERWSHGLMNKVGRTSATEVIKNFSKMMVSSFLQEGSEETVTNYSQDLTDYLTGVNPDALKGIHSRALESGIIGGFSGTGMTAPTGFSMSVIHARANKQTELQKNFYKALGESAEASKVRERLPLKYREMADKITKDGPAENIYIPVDKFTELFQSYEDGGLPGAISDLEADKAYQEAKETGGLVKIKTSIWAEKMAGTDHFNAASGDITFNPSEFTENESKEAAKALAEDPTSFDPSMFDGEKAIDGMTVQQQVQKMLENTGMSPENARKNAVVYRFFDTLAKRSGKTAEQIFGEYNLNITRPVPNAQVNNFSPEDAAKNKGLGKYKKNILETILDEAKQTKGGYSTFNPETNQRMPGVRSGPAYLATSEYPIKDIQTAFDKASQGMELTPYQDEIVQKIYEKSGYDPKPFDPESILLQVINAEDRFKQRQAEADIQRNIDEKQNAPEKTDHEQSLENLKSRFSGDDRMLKAIDKAQNPENGPYVFDKKLKQPIPNFESVSNGEIGKQGIAQPHDPNNMDPFAWYDLKYGATKKMIMDRADLEFENKDNSLVVHTSSDLVAHNDYINILDGQNTSVKMYLLTKNDELNRILFPGNPSRRRQDSAVEKLRESGVNVEAVRPTFESVIEAAGGEKNVEKSLGKDWKKQIENAVGSHLSVAPTELFQMAGRSSLTAPIESLSNAARMNADGKDMEEIRKETGWFMGPDKRWRYEISDENASFKELNLNKKKSYTLDQVLNHEELFRAYPQLKDLQVKFGPHKGYKGGHYNRESKEIKINIPLEPALSKAGQTAQQRIKEISQTQEYKDYISAYETGDIEKRQKARDAYRDSGLMGEMMGLTIQMNRETKKEYPKVLQFHSLQILLHEVQHAIQDIEGFARGTNKSEAGGYKNYQKTLGEVEARDAEARKNLTPEERKNTPPATQTFKNPIINWGSVKDELPIEVSPAGQIKFGEQMSLFQSKQEEQIKRGRILFDSNGNYNIEFLKHADATTFLHETAHFFLEVFGDQASKTDAPDAVKEDYAKILKYLGVESRDQIETKHHEKFAESFENYLLEGKVPVSELRDTFASIKAWFIGIYKSITAAYPGVKLSADIRGVFDRMLATEEEIMRAQHEIGATPLIPNTDGVLSKADAEKYVKLIEKERELAADQSRAKAMKTLTREMIKIRKEREAEILADVTREVESYPDQVILSIIRTGEAPGHPPMPEGSKNFKLDRRITNKLYDEKIVSQLPRGIFGKEGQHPNIVAGLLMHSQATGADLITMLANTPDKKELIDQKVQEQMNAEFPDPILDGSIVQNAMDAVHNDFGAERRQFEIDVMMKNRPAAVKGMIKSITARKISITQFRAKAEEIISTTAVREIRPVVYQRGEIKHAKEAVRLFLKGDFDGAIEAKQKEILNHELYRVAIKANEEVQKAQDRFNKVFRKDEKLAKTRDMAYVNAARAVLAEFGIGKSDNDAEYYLAPIRAYNPDLYTQMKELVDLATANAGNHRDVSFQVFTDMANSFDQLWQMSKIAHQITIDGKKLDRFTAQDEMATIINEMSQGRGNGEEFARAPNEADERKMTFGSLKSAFKRVEFWVDRMDAGRIGGPFRRYIWEPVSGGVIKYRLAKNQYMDQFLKLIQDHTKGFSEEAIKAPELVGLPNDQGVPSAYLFQNKAELLGAMLHIGNESNLRKLLVGNRWGSLDENGILDSSAWDSFITRMQNNGTLTKADYDFLQGCWDLMEKLKPDAQKAHYEVYGYHFAEITSKELVTPFGTYKGGYAPAAIDRLRTKNTKAQLKALEEGTDANYFPAQINGFSKSRVESYAAPLSMNLNLLPMHVDQVLRFTHITPRVKDVTKMLFDKSFRSTLEGFDPHVIDDFLVPWLDRSVKQSVVTPTKNRAADRFYRDLRSKTGMATMFLNVTNTLQQYTGIIVASVKVAPKHLRNSTWNFIKSNKEMADFAYETSDFMKTKINFQMSETQKEIGKILEKPSASEKVSEWFEKNAYALQGIAQNQVDIIVWHAAYSQAQDEGHNQKICIQLADSAVRTTQGTFAPEDVSKFETGSPLGRLFTMFSSYFNMLGNLLGSEFSKTIHQEVGIKKKAMQGLYIYAAGFMIPAVMSEAIMQALSGKGFDADDDDDYLDDFMALFFGSQAKTGFALVPVAGQAVMAGINRFNNQQWDDRISLSPVISMTESVVGVPYDIYRDIERGQLGKNTVRDGLTLISLLSGTYFGGIPILQRFPQTPKLPILPLSKPINYLQDIDSGRANPSGPIDVARGLITGKPGAP